MGEICATVSGMGRVFATGSGTGGVYDTGSACRQIVYATRTGTCMVYV